MSTYNTANSKRNFREFLDKGFGIRRLVLTGLVLVLIATQLFVSSVSAAIAFRSCIYGDNGGGAATVTISKPAGATAGDVLVIFLATDDANTVTHPSGWSQIRTDFISGDLRQTVAYKVLTSTDDSISTYQWTLSAASRAVGTVSAYSGVDNASPINAHAGNTYTASRSLGGPALQTTVTNTMVVTGITNNVADVHYNFSATERCQGSSSGGGSATSKLTTSIQDEAFASTGLNGNSASAYELGVFINQSIALKTGSGTPPPSVALAQEAYRFYTNNNSISPSMVLAAQDTPSSIAVSTPYRLRLLLDVSGADLTTGASNFVLQIGEKTSTCSGATYANATQFHDNSTVTDNAAINTTTEDPQAAGGGAQEVAQTYNENNAFTSINNVPVGDSGLWDFALTSSAGDAGKTFCFRVVYSDGAPLSGYMQYPEISFTSSGGGGSPSSIYMIPDGDVASVGWGSSVGGDGSCAGGTKCDYVDEGFNTDTSAIKTGTTSGADGDYVEFSLTSPTDVSSASQLVLYVAAATEAIEGSADTLNINLRVNGTLMTAVTTPALEFFSSNWYTATFTGTWTQADVNSMQVHISRNALGGGQASTRDDDAVLDSVYGSLTYSGTGTRSSLGQEAYRWFQNSDSNSPGSPLAASNTATSLQSQAPFRLRLLIDAASVNLPAGGARLKLQRGEKLSTCAAATYVDAVSFHDNPSRTDDDLAYTDGNGNDPVPVGGGAQLTNQTYNENAAFENISAIATGNSGLWEFALTSTSGDAGKTYCYRAVDDTGTAIASYSVYPEITFTSSGPTLNQQMRGGQSVNNGTKSPLVW